MKKTILNQFSYWLGVISIGLALGISIQFAGAWVAPTENPPSSNIGAPINTGLNVQIKTGALGIGSPTNAGAFKVYGSGSLGIFDGKVGIGTVSPSYKLHVTGDIYANGGWLRTSGSAGWYSESYGGGWFMQDSSWIRTYNSKSVWTNSGLLGSQGGLTVGYGGAGSPSGGAIIAGNVGIGTVSPTQKLDVSGYARASTGFCIGSNCITSWPSSSGDNLGNHTATTTLNMNGQSITNVNALYGSIFYDRDNTGYYVNPNGMSNMERVDFSYGYDRNNTAYYIDLNNTSRLNYLQLAGRANCSGKLYTDASGNVLCGTDATGSGGDNLGNHTATTTLNMNGQSITNVNALYGSIFYDRDNTGYYVNPASTSRIQRVDTDNLYNYGWMFSGILYDTNNQSYYVDPNGTSVFNAINLGGVTRTTWPDGGTTAEADTLDTVVQRGSITNHTVQINNNMGATRYYDVENTNYYVDPNGTSVFNAINLGGVTRTTWPSSSGGTSITCSWYGWAPVISGCVSGDTCSRYANTISFNCVGGVIIDARIEWLCAQCTGAPPGG